ncbi:hypothetical protein V1477_000328 [Vespula maculifrons]|uniref:Uncharacterized protein n=1 Tax=Vespula maculifrons TaxID=7453 RepID=A0ABD2D198_VESMC
MFDEIIIVLETIKVTRKSRISWRRHQNHSRHYSEVFGGENKGACSKGERMTGGGGGGAAGVGGDGGGGDGGWWW